MQRNKPPKFNPEVAKLKERVKVVRTKLPKGYRDIFFETYPQYNSYRGAQLVNNVLVGQATDITVTELLEDLAEKLQNASV
jgi:hypothetical protein